MIGESELEGKASERVKREARLSLVVGIVDWALRDGGQEAVSVAVEACLNVAGDPRHSMALWKHIPERTVRALSWAGSRARTIENMFRVIATLRTDSPEQVQSRLAFWRGYLPHMRRAYLVCADRAQPIAEELKERYGEPGRPRSGALRPPDGDRRRPRGPDCRAGGQ